MFCRETSFGVSRPLFTRSTNPFPWRSAPRCGCGNSTSMLPSTRARARTHTRTPINAALCALTKPSLAVVFEVPSHQNMCFVFYFPPNHCGPVCGAANQGQLGVLRLVFIYSSCCGASKADTKSRHSFHWMIFHSNLIPQLFWTDPRSSCSQTVTSSGCVSVPSSIWRRTRDKLWDNFDPHGESLHSI